MRHKGNGLNDPECEMSELREEYWRHLQKRKKPESFIEVHYLFDKEILGE